jgi:DNA sulfur modification protein DndB
MKRDANFPRKAFPALRCIMGDWVYYVTFLRFFDVEFWIKKTDQIHRSEKLREMIQRELTPRVAPIADYLIEQKERFFNSIVVGVYEGDPKWYPLEINDSPSKGKLRLDHDAATSIGVLVFNGEEKLFAIDGQHRVEAIKEALKKDPNLAEEDISAIFVSHKKDENGRKRTRRLFSTLNKYAKPVSKGEIVALDEDDAYAIVTRRLVEEFDLLKSGINKETGFVNFSKTAPLRPNDQTSLTSILALYEIVQNIHIPVKNSQERQQMLRLKIRCPSDKKIDMMVDEIYQEQVKYWQLLRKHFIPYMKLFDSKPENHIAGKYRTPNGGHLLFRPAGQILFSRVVRILMDRNQEMEDVIILLSEKVPMELDKTPWKYTFWNPDLLKINTKTKKVLLESIILHCAGEELNTRNFVLLKEYRNAVGDQTIDLP